MDFSSKPVLVFWETTKACMLACRHCRASAIHTQLPGELTTDEGRMLIDQIASFGGPAPVVVFTGGDPLMRGDIFELLEYAKRAGLKFAVSPAVTGLLTREKLEKLRDAGVTSISVSLDGACSGTHDGIRTVDGTFDCTLEVMRDAVDIGLGIQVNTTVMKRNIGELARIFHLIKGIGIRTWEVFFLIKVGRGAELEELDPAAYESSCNFLYDASKYGMVVRTVEAPFMRRVAKMREGGLYWADKRYTALHDELVALEGEPTFSSTISPRGTLDGDGIVFVGYDGAVYPGGFLPERVGNVREGNIVQLYRENPIMRDIRERRMEGKCGGCGYRAACGGSRARAYAACGNPLASDPACMLVAADSIGH